MPEIQIEAAGDRPSQEAQIQSLLEESRERNAPVRCRIPLQMYSTSKASYVGVQDASWRLTLPTETTQEELEALIGALGACLVAIAREGAETVMARVG